MSLKEIYRNKWVRMSFWAILYTLWVIWLGNYWWLLGLIIIFDHHITRKVKWLFWKKNYKEGEKKNILLEWLDAIIFAVVVVTFINTFFFRAFEIPSSSMESTLYTGDHLFVSKLAYGPKIPQTPLTIPFTHNVFMGKESYSTIIRNNYRRLKGFRQVREGDCVVFNFPNGDTVLTKAPTEDYYALCRALGKENVIANYGPIIVRPSDKKDHYVKRCVAVAGDTLSIIKGRVYINSKPQQIWDGVQFIYRVKTDGNPINSKIIDDMGLNLSEVEYNPILPGYLRMPLTASMLEKVKSLPNVLEVVENIEEYSPLFPDSYKLIFPFKEDYKWTSDNFGPLWIPKQGVTVELNLKNLPLYERVIRVYENNKLTVTPDGDIYINGEKTNSYKFKQNYYFMMGDNRGNSLDSRYWGFVPEDHIVGRPSLVWLSLDKNRSFPMNIRWNRFFKIV